ncbi:MAG: hypothetical protein IPK03_02015 [Bacteroidetes bacterium]|nr:hypothetical protein [Bacteroidota bacterium]
MINLIESLIFMCKQRTAGDDFLFRRLHCWIISRTDCSCTFIAETKTKSAHAMASSVSGFALRSTTFLSQSAGNIEATVNKPSGG